MAEPDEDDEAGLGETARAERGAAPYLAAMWRLVGAMAVAGAVGFVVDRKLGTQPWGLVVGLAVGLAAGFVSLIQRLAQLGKR